MYFSLLAVVRRCPLMTLALLPLSCAMQRGRQPVVVSDPNHNGTVLLTQPSRFTARPVSNFIHVVDSYHLAAQREGWHTPRPKS